MPSPFKPHLNTRRTYGNITQAPSAIRNTLARFPIHTPRTYAAHPSMTAKKTTSVSYASSSISPCILHVTTLPFRPLRPFLFPPTLASPPRHAHPLRTPGNISLRTQHHRLLTPATISPDVADTLVFVRASTGSVRGIVFTTQPRSLGFLAHHITDRRHHFALTGGRDKCLAPHAQSCLFIPPHLHRPER